jgi:Uma2 family endonuclease
MGLHAQVTLMSHEDYLEGELHSEIKHEYVAGHIYAMSGASRAHNRISLNCSYLLQTGLSSTPCDVYVSDVKVRVEAADAFYYPDVVVGCEPKDNNQYYLTQPKIIIEVLSPSTAQIDKREKLLSYKTIDSLQEYIIIAQDKCEIMLYERIDIKNWNLTILGKNDKFKLESIDLEIVVSDIYARTDLEC